MMAKSGSVGPQDHVSAAPAPSASRQRAAQLAPGDRVGRYQLLLEVAQGGMGRVWAARQRGQHGFSKIVALKTALGELASNPEAERLFLDEARLAARIEHPHVCSILELGDEEGVLYMVMEWVGGDSLHALLKASPDRRLEPRIAARIIAQAASGLHAAHELRDESDSLLHVVHRDVSPQNILLTVDGHAKVADFGVAKAKNQVHQSTATGAVKGKLSYMAPEQFAQKSYDRRVDVFALGCVLYEATVGCKAFDAGESAATIYQIMEGRYIPPHELVPSYPRELEAIVRRAMARSPQERYASAEDLRRALEQWLITSGSAVTEDDVRGVLRGALGASIEARTERIRDATSRVESLRYSQPGLSGNTVPLPSIASAPSASTQRSRVAPSRTGTLLIVGGVVAAMIAGGMVAAKRPRRGTAKALVTASASLVAETSATPASSASVAQPAATSINVHVRATPRTAQLSIDDGPALPLPYDGQALRDERPHVLRIFAPNYDDERRTVQFTESQTVDVTLKPRAARAAEPAPKPAPAQSVVVKVEPAPHAEPPPAPTRSAPHTKKRRPIDSTDPFAE